MDIRLLQFTPEFGLERNLKIDYLGIKHEEAIKKIAHFGYRSIVRHRFGCGFRSNYDVRWIYICVGSARKYASSESTTNHTHFNVLMQLSTFSPVYALFFKFSLKKEETNATRTSDITVSKSAFYELPALNRPIFHELPFSIMLLLLIKIVTLHILLDLFE